MQKNAQAGITLLLIPAFFIYFFTESLLRQAAVAFIDPEETNIDAVMTSLPSAVSEPLSERIRLISLKDAVMGASTSPAKAYSIINLAEYIDSKEEKERLLTEVYEKYPKLPEACRAYTFFFLNPNTKIKLSIQDFHAYINRVPELQQLSIWSAGLSHLKAIKSKPEQQFEYLNPLMEITPKYRDFGRLYRELSTLAGKLKKTEIAEKAQEIREKCSKLPSIDSVMMKLEAEKAKKAKQKRTDPTKEAKAEERALKAKEKAAKETEAGAKKSTKDESK